MYHRRYELGEQRSDFFVFQQVLIMLGEKGNIVGRFFLNPNWCSDVESDSNNFEVIGEIVMPPNDPSRVELWNRAEIDVVRNCVLASR